MTKILTWNIGCAFPLHYAKYFGFIYKGQKFKHNFFQPILNGEFVSKQIEKINPDILFLQEIKHREDLNHLKVLQNYPHQKLVDPWYHKHAILIASKEPFTTRIESNFSIILFDKVHFIPIHLNSFFAKTRLYEFKILKKISEKFEKVIVLGDTNIWSRDKFFLFRNDKKAYKNLADFLDDSSSKIISTTILGFGLDKVFASKNLSVKKIECLKTRNYFMDHYPITFEIH